MQNFDRQYYIGWVSYSNIIVPVLVDNPSDHMQIAWRNHVFYEAHSNMEGYHDGMLHKVWEIKGECPEPWLDIGACIGNHSLFFNRVCRKKVVAWEPDLSNAELLAGNLSINNTHAHIVVAAAGAKEGRGAMKQMFSPEGKTHMGMKQVVAGDDIDIRTIDSMQQVFGLIKIDAEEYNREVLIGAEQTLRKSDAQVFIECPTQEELDEANAMMSDYGYVLQDGVWNATPTYLWKKK